MIVGGKLWHVVTAMQTNSIPGQIACTPSYLICKQRQYNASVYKDNYRRLNMIGRERATRALIGCDSQ